MRIDEKTFVLSPEALFSPACSLIGRSSCACCVRTVRVVFNEARWVRFRSAKPVSSVASLFCRCVFGRIVSWKCESEKKRSVFRLINRHRPPESELVAYSAPNKRCGYGLPLPMMNDYRVDVVA